MCPRANAICLLCGKGPTGLCTLLRLMQRQITSGGSSPVNSGISSGFIRNTAPSDVFSAPAAPLLKSSHSIPIELLADARVRMVFTKYWRIVSVTSYSG